MQTNPKPPDRSRCLTYAQLFVLLSYTERCKIAPADCIPGTRMKKEVGNVYYRPCSFEPELMPACVCVCINLVQSVQKGLLCATKTWRLTFVEKRKWTAYDFDISGMVACHAYAIFLLLLGCIASQTPALSYPVLLQSVHVPDREEFQENLRTDAFFGIPGAASPHNV
eukprot:1158508-Pelagomonas_calceolata.AAC.46